MKPHQALATGTPVEVRRFGIGAAPSRFVDRGDVYLGERPPAGFGEAPIAGRVYIRRADGTAVDVDPRDVRAFPTTRNVDSLAANMRCDSHHSSEGEMQIDSRTVQAILDIKPSTLRLYADRMPAIAHHGKQGKARPWSLPDVVALRIAQDLASGGLSHPTALAIANIARGELERLLLSDDAQAYVLAKPDASRREGIVATVTHDLAEAIDLVAPGGADRETAVTIAVDLRRAFEKAFREVRSALEAEKPR